MINPATLSFIKSHREEKVERLAFLRDRYPDVDFPVALDQISGWQTARRKLPLWASFDGILYPPHLNMEQCSSEPTALYKANLAERLVKLKEAKAEFQKSGSSDICQSSELQSSEHLPLKIALSVHQHFILYDLTGGFGVDFSWMSRAFGHAVYAERDARLCEIACHNFQVLGLRNVEVAHTDGVELLHQLPDDAGSAARRIIYLDPARRDSNGHRVFGIADCTPDVVALKDELLHKADTVIIKLSPMLDWHEAVRQMGNVVEVHIVSVGNECKELLLVLSENHQPLHMYCVNDNHCYSYAVDEPIGEPNVSQISDSQVFLVPNSSVMKAGCFDRLLTDYPIVRIEKRCHFFVAAHSVEGFPGRQFRILRTTSFNKKDLRQALSGVTHANIAARQFPMTADELRKKLKLKDGGSLYLFATTVGKEHRLFITEKVL